MYRKDYKEIIYEIRGSDLPPEKLDYVIPDNIKVQRVAAGVSGKKEDIELTKFQRERMLKYFEHDTKNTQNETRHTQTLCSCKTKNGKMHETKLVDGLCKFCKSIPYIGIWNKGYELYDKDWDKGTKSNFKIKSQDEKDKFLALAKKLEYNKTHIAEATGLHINTVRNRLKKYKKDIKKQNKIEFLVLCKRLDYSPSKIARETGISINTVKYRLKYWRKDV